MAKENVEKFFVAVMADEEKKNKLQQLNKGNGDIQPDEAARVKLTADHILPLAEEMGCPFTLEELKAYETEKIKQLQAEGELLEEQLEAVAGGVGFTFGVCLLFGIGIGETVGLVYCNVLGADLM